MSDKTFNNDKKYGLIYYLGKTQLCIGGRRSTESEVRLKKRFEGVVLNGTNINNIQEQVGRPFSHLFPLRHVHRYRRNGRRGTTS